MTAPVEGTQPAKIAPLTPEDPAKVGDYWLDARLAAGPGGVAYVAHDDDGTSAMLIMTSAGAAADPAARARLAGEVNRMHIDTVLARGGQDQDEGRLGHRFRPEDDDPVAPHHAPLAPWVALAYEGSSKAFQEAVRLLRTLDLSNAAPQGNVAGPDYRLHWIDNTRPGPNRLWPLPWPGRHDRAGWMTMLVSWLLMLLLTALAVLIAILLFQNAPPQTPPPPVPTDATGTGGASAPPTPGGDPGTPSHTPSMEQPSPEGTASGEGSPTPNKRL